MLELVVPQQKWFNEETSKFIVLPEVTLRLEHSLVALSKWESLFEKPFLGKEDRTNEETLEYIRCMSVDEKIPPEVFSRLSSDNYNAINTYINAKMTATTIFERPGGSINRETITSELIYYWMVSHNIPFECENWHLSRLIMLIRVCNHKNAPPRKVDRHQAAAERHRLNQLRRQRTGSSG